MSKQLLALTSALIFGVASAADLSSEQQKTSYVVGYEMGIMLKETEDKRIDLDAAIAGISDTVAGQINLAKDERKKIIDAFTVEQQKRLKEKAEKELADAKAKLAQTKPELLMAQADGGAPAPAATADTKPENAEAKPAEDKTTEAKSAEAAETKADDSAKTQEPAASPAPTTN